MHEAPSQCGSGASLQCPQCPAGCRLGRRGRTLTQGASVVARGRMPDCRQLDLLSSPRPAAVSPTAQLSCQFSSLEGQGLEGSAVL